MTKQIAIAPNAKYKFTTRRMNKIIPLLEVAEEILQQKGRLDKEEWERLELLNTELNRISGFYIFMIFYGVLGVVLACQSFRDLNGAQPQ